MIRNYFKIAWRNLRSKKAYALINIVGLSMGLACGILIFILIQFQLSFENFHQNKDRIYRAVTEFHDESVNYSRSVPQPFGNAFRKDFDFAEQTAMVVDYRNVLISLPGDKQVKKFEEQEGVVYAQPSFFKILNFPLLKGNPKTALADPNSALVTEKIARKYFGNEEAMGKIIRVDNGTNFTVKGILKDIPANTDRRHEIYLSYENLKDRNAWLASDSSWGGVYSGTQCYLLLKPSVTAAQVNKALPLISTKYYNGREAQIFRFRLQPLSDIHFNSDFDGNADRKYLWALSLIGLFLIITACVNFVNLATAQALNRSKEVGVRKVLGGLRSQLFWQFIAETAVITVLACILATGMAALVLPYLNNLLESEMHMNLLGQYQLPLFLVIITILTIFLAGSYPGLVLARFQPVMALKSKLSQKHIGGFSLRRVLVVAQFAISQMLIIGVIVIAGQIRYARNTDLGFRKDAIVTLPIPVADKVKLNTMHSRMAALPGVEKISFCWQPPASGSNNNTDVVFDNRTESEHWNINLKAADDQYISTFGLKLVAGRNFYPSDTTREFVVNETFVKKLNLQSPEEVIGKIIAVNGSSIKAPIVGVVKDFYNYSMHSEIAPICIMPDMSSYRNCAVMLNPANMKNTLASMEKIWGETYPDYLFNYQFLDDRIRDFYKMDSILLNLIQAFALVAIIIGCLGLYGLVSFMAIRKTKEIGVRKVLGAGMPQILWLFGREFSKLLLLAFVIAAPLAWWAMHYYLQDYKYRIPLGIEIFALAILSSFFIAFIAVGYRSLRSAMANPVKSLRTE